MMDQAVMDPIFPGHTVTRSQRDSPAPLRPDFDAGSFDLEVGTYDELCSRFLRIKRKKAFHDLLLR
jgi:hypothetical protein